MEPIEKIYFYAKLSKKFVIFLISVPTLFYYLMPLDDLNNFVIVSKNKLKSNTSQYAVNTPACKIIEMDPFAFGSMNGIFKKIKPMTCSPLIAKLENERLVLEEKLQAKWNPKNSTCCYRVIKRVQQDPKNYNKNADWDVKYSNCHPIPFGKQGALMNDTFFKVECKGFGNEKGKTEFYGIPIHPKSHSNATEKKVEYWEKRAKTGSHIPPSILIIGVDSSSRLHTMRSLPKTRDFILKNDFIELKGYTKLASNTFPNIMAGFAGMEIKKYESCWPNEKSKLDDCPYIWKNFSQLNYITAFLEDAPTVGTFNYGKIGFVTPPADYYIRPVNAAATINRHWRHVTKKFICVNGMNPTVFQCDYIQKFITNMKGDYPYFLFSWYTSIGHDDFNGLQTTDETFRQLFSVALNNTNANPDNTVIIFMSDHGYRFGKFRQSFLGYFEESLPFFFIRLPPKLKESYPHWYDNLKVNSERLVSPFDLHSTLKQILYNAKESIQQQNSNYESRHPTLFESNASLQTNESKSSNFIGNKFNSDNVTEELIFENALISSANRPQHRKRYSFFEFIPDNRTCQAARIPQHYCMCGISPPEIGNLSVLTKKFGDLIIYKVNDILSSVIKSEKCRSLEFSKLLYGREVGHGITERNISYKDYIVAIEANPSKARFEAKVRAQQQKNSTTNSIIGEITRINAYEGQSDCVTDLHLKNFCYCTDLKNKVLDKQE